MNYRSLASTFVGALCVTVLAACGGGGGDTPSAGTQPLAPQEPNTNVDFPLKAAFLARINSGAKDVFDISGGTCIGIATITLAPSVDEPFEGISAIASPQQFTLDSLSSCPVNLQSSTGKTYYTKDSYAHLGQIQDGSEFAKFNNSPTPLPANVKIGQSGSIVVLNSYGVDRTTLVGTRTIKWKVDNDGDSKTSATFNLIFESRNTSNLLTSTQQSSYRLGQTGPLTFKTVTFDFYGSSGIAAFQLLYTKR